MSLTPRLTLIGLYKYNPLVFENLVLPNIVDEEIFIDSLMLEYGECPLIYPDFDFMKLAIGAWSRKWYNNIERIATAIQEEYNPLYNYDRTETWTENEEGTKDFTRGITDGESETENQSITENRTVNEDGTITENGTVNEEGTEDTDKTETENKTDENLVSAYNEDNYQPSTKTVTDRTTQTTIGTETEKSTTSANTTTDEKDTTDNKTTSANKTDRRDRSTDETYNENNGRQNTKTGRAFGNIGVTTSTEMLQREIDIRRTENLYHIIAELFYKEFCIYVF